MHSAAINADLCGFFHVTGIEIPQTEPNDVILLIGTDEPDADIPVEALGHMAPFRMQGRQML